MVSSSIKINAIIFDLDDTLISEKQYIESGYRRVAEVISDSIDANKSAIFKMLIGLFSKNPQNVFNRLFDNLNIPYDKEDIFRLVEVYRNHLPDIQFYEDVIPCLEQLRAKGVKIGIITDGYTITQRNKLKVLNAEKYFDHIILTEELGRAYWKPHPRSFELMKKILEVEFDKMFYVGDNPEKDFYISCIYPIKTVRICREGVYKNRKYFENVKENYLIHSLEDIIKL